MSWKKKRTEKWCLIFVSNKRHTSFRCDFNGRVYWLYASKSACFSDRHVSQWHLSLCFFFAVRKCFSCNFLNDRTAHSEILTGQCLWLRITSNITSSIENLFLNWLTSDISKFIQMPIRQLSTWAPFKISKWVSLL